MRYIFSKSLSSIIFKSLQLVERNRNQFITPEHILLSVFSYDEVVTGCNHTWIEASAIVEKLSEYIDSMEKLKPEKYDGMIYNSAFTSELFAYSSQRAEKLYRVSDDKQYYIITVTDIIASVRKLKESWAKNIISAYISDNQFVALIEYIEDNFSYEMDPDAETIINDIQPDNDDDLEDMMDYDPDEDLQIPDDEAVNDSNNNNEEESEQNANEGQTKRTKLPCISDEADSHAPIIGREEEINLTIQCLCRRDKHNPLHIGESGVGKTALIYKLAQRINQGDVPECLLGYRIFSLDTNLLMAGTRYRGELEQRINSIMENMVKIGRCILYLDNIHNIMGAGKGADGSPGVAELIMPYLDDKRIRIIGSTTYQDFKKNMERNASLIRRFQQIEIKEPSIEDTIEILKGLKKVYEKHHGVYYTNKAIEEAVMGSKKYITNRFLPDKAIDIIDDAGAYRVMHPLDQNRQTVNDELIRDIIYKMCKIDAKVITDKNNVEVSTLLERISNKIFGQNEAVRQVVDAVEISKAGLGDELKPMASMLFVGSTGVGKTELAKVLAEELNVQLVRFDMSEYTEKHTVAKFIGSPAGYVGYEEGGLLTDAIRKSPNCILLLDEIEKAHQDIYNILLQIMDYGTLTDNHGLKADFKNVILIMTSNAGAQYASQASVGFASHTTAAGAMVKEVKRVFKPEFINRLTCITMFNDMTREMAELIMDKKLTILSNKLAVQNIVMTLDDSARDLIMQMGFSPKYGAREMERTISRELKPLLTHEILYGKLKKGGKIHFGAKDKKIVILNITK